MATTTPNNHHHPRHTSVREAVSELLWFWAISILLLTLALVIVGGTEFIGTAPVQAVMGTMLALSAIHVTYQFRHRGELRRDPRLLRDRERRGY